MRTKILKKIRIAAGIVFFCLIVVYIYVQTSAFLKGAEIVVINPQNGSLVQNGIIELEGRALNISWISVNGRSIFVNEEGYFEEKEVLQEGRNSIAIEAGDKFGNRDKEIVSVIYKPSI